MPIRKAGISRKFWISSAQTAPNPASTVEHFAQVIQTSGIQPSRGRLRHAGNALADGWRNCEKRGVCNRCSYTRAKGRTMIEIVLILAGFVYAVRARSCGSSQPKISRGLLRLSSLSGDRLSRWQSTFTFVRLGAQSSLRPPYPSSYSYRKCSSRTASSERHSS